ncbi:MAG: nitrate reductase subunit alpha, partial [Phyllobacteriaceae bacterium]|nr:nitrate reductase subunit alpha [Phyllobacteriaceae bacterium]
MSHFLDRLTFFKKNVDTFSDGHGVVTDEDRSWEDGYRKRWQHDKIVRSTHGANCTGSCSWKIYVKGGIVTWETQQTDYPRTRPDLPNHEPRGCQRGASASWYLYSGNRIKYPMVRARLLRQWREERRTKSPVAAWAAIQADPAKRANYVGRRGLGGFVRSTWDEVNEIITAANAHTIKTHGPDRIAGFSPIPAMSMVSYAAGARYLSLLGGTCLSFYDWYCDLPPASPQTWGEQTDVPESADWYNAGFLMVWGSNVPQTRTPDAHFYTEVRYKGAKSVVVSPDYSEASKFADVWLHPKQGTDAALALAMGHVIFKEFHLDRRVPYFDDYCRRYTDMPLLVRLDEQGGRFVPGRMLRASDLTGSLGETNNPEWKTVGFDETTGDLVAPLGAVGFRWGESGKWNLEPRDGKGEEVSLRLSLLDARDDVVAVDFPYFGNRPHEHFRPTSHDSVISHPVPVRRLTLADGSTVPVATVFDLFAANYGLDRGLGDENAASSYADDKPYSPAWAERVCGVPAGDIVTVAREFADNAEKTNGRSMVILGAGLNHWYHMDMHYRAIINLLVMCGCIGQSGGGWSHYVGQEKLRPQTGWTPLAFALDWHRPPRHMNGTSYFYAHTDQWRYETIQVDELLSPTAPEGDWRGSLIDYNIRAERMGWLPSSPQLKQNPLTIAAKAGAAGKPVADYLVDAVASGEVELSCQDPDDPANWPRNLFVWRSNLLGSSGKGHEYFLKHLIGAPNSVMSGDLGEQGPKLVREARWHDKAPEGKLDLLVTLDFRMSTTCLHSDIVLPTATWYEKNDLNTTDMHPFIHPLSKAVDPAWEARSDWDIFRGFAETFSRVAPEVLGVETDVVLTPILHDTPEEIAQALDVKDWKRGEIAPIAGRTMPSIAVIERDYAQIGAKFCSLGPLMNTIGNGGKGIAWKTEHEVEFLGKLNGLVAEPGVAEGRPAIRTDIDATEVILSLAPETNGEVAVKAWEALSKITGRDHTHLALPKEDEKIRFRDIVAQPRKIISSPTWSGLESEKVCYNAGYTNVHE